MFLASDRFPGTILQHGASGRKPWQPGDDRPRLFPQSRRQVYDEDEMSLASPAYFEIIDFIAAGTTPEAVTHFRPSPEAQQRVAELIEREKAARLSPEEQAELDHFMELEHILRMAKARARQILSRGQ